MLEDIGRIGTATGGVYRLITESRKKTNMDANRRKKQLNKKTVIAGSPKRAERGPTKSTVGIIKGWPRRHPVFLFLVVFAALMGLFYFFTTVTSFYNNRFIPWYHCYIAFFSGTILDFLGQDITVRGASIFSPRFSVQIIRGCDAIEPVALFICAVLAFPASFSKKISGIIVGTLLLMILNLVRIVSLFLIGVYLPRIVDVMHIEVWQVLFIFSALIFWVFWLLWAIQNQSQTRGVLIRR